MAGIIRRLAALAAVALVIAWLAPTSRPSHATDGAPAGGDAGARDVRDRRVVILGFDGLDPQVCRDFFARGELPNLRALADAGGFRELQTSMPPLSPVAWSDFTTGADPSLHGIFDFVHRDPDTCEPVSSMACSHPACCTVAIGGYQIPIGGSVELLRRGEAFWQVLDRNGVATTIIACPASYPPPTSNGRSLSGMGTPDLMGTQGRFSCFIERTADDVTGAPGSGVNPVPDGGVYPSLPPDPTVADDPREGPGGRIERISFDEHGQWAGELRGFLMPLRSDPIRATVPLRITKDPTNGPGGAALVDLDGTRVLIGPGEWSPWIPLQLPLGIPGASTRGMVRMLLREVSPRLRLYISPINIDPVQPAQTLSTPGGYARELAEATGRFYTETIPEDVAALEAGVLDRAEFRELLDQALREREAQLDYELARHRRGLLYAYFGGSDLGQHMFWREMTGENVTDAPWRGVVLDVYRALDAIVGRAMKRLTDDPDALLLVMSDHGFARFRRAFDVNAWLAREGYLTPAPGATRGFDRALTRAFGMGLNGLWLNQQGREADGIVPAAEADALRREIRERLLAERDPVDNAPVFREVYITRELYPATVDRPEIDRRAPDLLLGYARGYRTLAASAEGRVGTVVLRDNQRQWSGDHCIDWREVPGVLFANRPLPDATITLRDLAPTILRGYGLDPTAQMTGTPIFDRAPR